MNISWYPNCACKGRISCSEVLPILSDLTLFSKLQLCYIHTVTLYMYIRSYSISLQESSVITDLEDNWTSFLSNSGILHGCDPCDAEKCRNNQNMFHISDSVYHSQICRSNYVFVCLKYYAGCPDCTTVLSAVVESCELLWIFSTQKCTCV